VSSPPSTSSTASLAVTSALSRLLSIGEGLFSASTSADLTDAAARIAARRVNVVVLGAFKRGKSSLLNALLGQAVLPTGVLPLTSVITVVRNGPRERLVINRLDGSSIERPIGDLAQFVTEASNPGNVERIDTLYVELPHPLLEAGLQLVDTPGVASVHKHNTETARAALGRVDVALCVLAADQPLADSELELFEQVAGRAGRVLVAVNRIDTVDAADRAAVLAFVAERLDAAGLAADDQEVFAVSAREGAGLQALRATLAELALGDRDQLLATSVKATVMLAARELDRMGSVESRALELPLEDLDRRTHRLREQLARLAEERSDAEDLMRQRTDHALRTVVDEPLLGHGRRRGSELDQVLDEEARRLGRIGPRQLAASLDQWIGDVVREELRTLAPAIEANIGGALQALQQRHAETIASILHDLDDAVGDMLGSRIAGPAPELAVRQPSRFTFKLDDPEHALDRLAAATRSALPGSAGRRLVVAAAREQLHAMIDRHAGRLRSELSGRVRVAADEYARELADLVLRASETVERALARARERREDGAAEIRARLDELALVRETARSILEQAGEGESA
jgi:small GTP-binding protein